MFNIDKTTPPFTPFNRTNLFLLPFNKTTPPFSPPSIEGGEFCIPALLVEGGKEKYPLEFSLF